MKISIVIPVYNEQDVISDCLTSVINQIRPFDEILVIDNNSSDATATIANTFNQVKVINENKQGVAHAVSRGYDQASGDIIARIDGDTILPSDWTIQLSKIFLNKNISAVSGTASYYDVNLSKAFNKLDLFFRNYHAANLDKNFLWGANMALTKNAWEDVKSKLCLKKNIHEDYDLAIHLQENGHNVLFSRNLKAHVSSRRIESKYTDFMSYVFKSPKSYSSHQQKAWRVMMPLIICLGVFYLPLKLMHLSFDKNKGGFSLSTLFNPKQTISRVDPTTNVV